MTLGIVLLQGLRRGVFLVSEVPLYLRLPCWVWKYSLVQRSVKAPTTPLQGYLTHKKPRPPRTLQ